jgi:hypothetical protein
MTPDVATPLAKNGQVLVLSHEALELSARHPAEYVALVFQRALACISRPKWGVLFTNGEEIT